MRFQESLIDCGMLHTLILTDYAGLRDTLCAFRMNTLIYPHYVFEFQQSLGQINIGKLERSSIRLWLDREYHLSNLFHLNINDRFSNFCADAR